MHAWSRRMRGKRAGSRRRRPSQPLCAHVAGTAVAQLRAQPQVGLALVRQLLLQARLLRGRVVQRALQLLNAPLQRLGRRLLALQLLNQVGTARQLLRQRLRKGATRCSRACARIGLLSDLARSWLRVHVCVSGMLWWGACRHALRGGTGKQRAAAAPARTLRTSSDVVLAACVECCASSSWLSSSSSCASALAMAARPAASAASLPGAGQQSGAGAA